jgi:hypothetical protein
VITTDHSGETKVRRPQAALTPPRHPPVQADNVRKPEHEPRSVQQVGPPAAGDRRSRRYEDDCDGGDD